MKKFLFTITLITICLSGSAQQKTGSFSQIRNEARVKMIIDYSEASFMGMSESQFSEFEEDWVHDKVEMVSLYYSSANEKLKGVLTLGDYSFETPFTLRLMVRSIDVKGNHDCDLFLLNKDGEELAKIIGLRAKGGTFGSKLNLMKDGAEHTGEEIGSLLYSEITLTPRGRNRRK